MENDEKMEKVMNELERRKKIIEALEESIRMSPERFVGYAFIRCIEWNSLIDDALCFVRDDFVKYDKCDYSDSKSFIKSVEECCVKQPFLMSYRNLYYDFDTMILYIGTVIDDMNSNYYPTDPYEIFGRKIEQ